MLDPSWCMQTTKVIAGYGKELPVGSPRRGTTAGLLKFVEAGVMTQANAENARAQPAARRCRATSCERSLPRFEWGSERMHDDSKGKVLRGPHDD
jgi:hypothetical protein